MSRIKVYILNYHGIHSHIEIVLENPLSHEYYRINRYYRTIEVDRHNRMTWSNGSPSTYWSQSLYKSRISYASSKYVFEIEADPQDMIVRWNRYWHSSIKNTGLFHENCATAVQWFLKEFAAVPDPDLSNISFNYVTLGIFYWPSLIPSPITLPGRVFSNAKFHLDVRNHPEISERHSKAYWYTCAAASILATATSVLGLNTAISLVEEGLSILDGAGYLTVGAAGLYGLFKSYNALSAKRLIEKSKDSSRNLGLIYV